MPSDPTEGPIEGPPDLSLRPAVPEEADALAALYLASREAAFPAMPPPVHPPDEVRRWLRGRVADPDTEVWLAESGGRAVGLLVLEGSWVHSLYVAPDRVRHGVGSALLSLAQGLRPRLGLWVFAANDGARRFYAGHGFVEVRHTDGAENEEREPDVELAWPGPDSLPALRSRIDELDDGLARLLAERAEVTARVQRVKPVPGHAGRDVEREREIVRRMARLAPHLGEERLSRIMDAVITASLDAAADPPDPDRGGLP